jgi:hypothetical protein
MEDKAKPKVNSKGAQDLEKAQEQFDKFDESVKEMTMDRMNLAPKQETEPQAKISNREALAVKEVYLKPIRVISCKDKFNEKYRDTYNYDKVYVPFIAEHAELRGEAIEIWTRPYAGMPAEEWKVPTNKPIWGPRYLAEQIKRKFYHRLKMDNHSPSNLGVDSGAAGQMYGAIAVDTTVQRLDARPVSQKRSIFMGVDGT